MDQWGQDFDYDCMYTLHSWFIRKCSMCYSPSLGVAGEELRSCTRNSWELLFGIEIRK